MATVAAGAAGATAEALEAGAVEATLAVALEEGSMFVETPPGAPTCEEPTQPEASKAALRTRRANSARLRFMYAPCRMLTIDDA
jgi:hypothetical protein